jgi:hypothetical protein
MGKEPTQPVMAGNEKGQILDQRRRGGDDWRMTGWVGVLHNHYPFPALVSVVILGWLCLAPAFLSHSVTPW